MVSMPKFKFGVKRWRNPKVLWVLMTIELPLTIGLLTLFGIADPDTYRDLPWQDGFDNGFNSNPDQPIFNLDNGGKYEVPLVWSSFITQFNVVCAVLSMFALITKSIMVLLKWFPTLLSLIAHLILVGLYAYSIHGQTAPDTIDPEHPNYGAPWYIKYSCSVTKLKSNIGFCQQAKASFILTVFQFTLFIIYLLFSLYSIVFSPDPVPEADDDDEEEYYKPTSSSGKGKERGAEEHFGMVPIPMTPGSAMFPMSPMTPRTRAFSALEGPATRGPTFPPPPTEEGKKKKGKK